MAERQPIPVLKRREFIKAGIETGGGLVALLVGKIISDHAGEAIAQQNLRAELDVVNRQEKPKPTQEELDTLNGVKNDILARPFAKRDEEVMRRAEAIYDKKNEYDAAFNSKIRDIQYYEGDHSTEKGAGVFGEGAGLVLALRGLIRSAITAGSAPTQEVIGKAIIKPE